MSYGPSTSSGLKSASAQISAKNAYLYSIEIVPPSTGISVVSIYDNSAGDSSGLLLATLSQYAGESSKPMIFPMPINANKGLSAILSGTATNYVIHYAPA